MADHSLKYLVEEGEKVEVYVPTGRYEGDYLSVVHRITNEGLVIDMPMISGVQANIPQGKKLRLSYTRSDGASYRFESVVAFSQRTPVPLMYILKPKEILRRSMREFVRVECSLPTQIMLVDSADDEDGETYTGVITNISAGGLLVATSLDAQEMELLRFRFNLGSEDLTFGGIAGYVVAIRPPEDPHPEHQLAVEFKEIGDKDRDEIVKFCLETQLRLRRQGKL